MTSIESREKLIMMAEDELTQYSTDARKIERLRQKIGLTVAPAQQQQIKAELLADLEGNFFIKLLEEQRQAIALPFWGIGGLGLLLGISASQPLDFIATGVGFFLAIVIQRQGWKLEAKRLVVKTIEDIEKGIEQARESTKN